MLPTWRDAEIQSEIRKNRMQEASERRILNDLLETSEPELSTYDAALVRLGDWMVRAGEQLRSRCDDVSHAESALRSVEQGC